MLQKPEGKKEGLKIGPIHNFTIGLLLVKFLNAGQFQDRQWFLVCCHLFYATLGLTLLRAAPTACPRMAGFNEPCSESLGSSKTT
jgi:hypothetical protein